MARPPKTSDVRSPKRGAFPVPEDVLSAAAPYQPREQMTEPLADAPERSAPDAGGEHARSNAQSAKKKKKGDVLKVN